MISIVVCTYNRCESLRDTLRSLLWQEASAGILGEVIVVDNNSVDQTREVVEEFARQGGFPVRYVLERSQGIAYARNRGLLAAREEIVLFMDDDAVAEPGWMGAVARCFQETGADMVGGKVIPMWLTPRPEWLSNDLLGPMPRVDYGSQRKRLGPDNAAFLTTNCALRRSKLPKYGIFDVTLGRRGDRWVGGEDFELCERWARQGAEIYYEPSAVVHHKVGAERVTPEFYRKWFVDIGYTQAHQTDWKWHHLVSIIPAWRWKKLAEAGIRYVRAKGSASESARLQAELWWRFQTSFLKERFAHWTGRLRGSVNPACPFSRA
ncbi:MAG: glycosyltransferase [Candidatus Omnitrophica bacterium]|nr:glycosyltransferase [Candidatus Omnitrophota bacterium]